MQIIHNQAMNGEDLVFSTHIPKDVSEVALIIEALHDLKLKKIEAMEIVNKAIPSHMPKFTEHDFGITTIREMLDRFEEF